ncbi:MAG: ATP-binding protein, partial [Chloroflexota bacterium]
ALSAGLKFLNFFQPPAQEDDYLNRYVQIAWYAFLLGVLFCAYLTVYFYQQDALLNTLTTLVIAVSAVIGLILIRMGHLKFAVTMLPSMGYLAVFAGVMFQTGIDDIGVHAIYPIFVIISVLMSRQWSTFLGVLTILWIFLMVYLESVGVYDGVIDTYDPVTKGIIIVILFMLTMMFTRYTIQRSVLANEELNAARKEAEKSNQLKSLFLANMSHELRTPLNAIIGYSEVLLEENEDTQMFDKFATEDIDRIRRSGKHLLTLINDILDLSKIEAEKMELHPVHFDLNLLLYETIETIRPMADRNGNTIQLSNNFIEIEVFTDKGKLKQALLNLISNAAKYTQQGVISIRVFVNADDLVSITISDTGVGIPAEDLPYIFDSFRQVDNSLSRSFTGTGLGLSITKRLIELLNGSIWVNSTVEAGSAFTITIPLVYETQKKRQPISSQSG